MDDTRLPDAWCSDCRAAATRCCWDAHEVHNAKAALSRHVREVREALPPGEAAQIEGPPPCQGKEAMQALALLNAENCEVTLRAGDQHLTAAVSNNNNPLIKALWLGVVAKTMWLSVSPLTVVQEDHAAVVQKDRATVVQEEFPAVVQLVKDLDVKDRAAFARDRAAVVQKDRAAVVQEKFPAVVELLKNMAGIKPEERAANARERARAEAKTLALRAARRRELRVWSLDELHLGSLGPPGKNQCNKDKAVLDARGVEQINLLFCDSDPSWALQVLQSAASTLQELDLGYAREEHVRAAHAMPRLRRLVFHDHNLKGYLGQPYVLPAAPPGCLVMLEIRHYIHRVTLQSMLQAHEHSLDVLKLFVKRKESDRRHMNIDELISVLKQCDLRALRRLVLFWRDDCRITPAPCQDVVGRVRETVPDAEVNCVWCDRHIFLELIS